MSEFSSSNKFSSQITEFGINPSKIHRNLPVEKLVEISIQKNEEIIKDLSEKIIKLGGKPNLENKNQQGFIKDLTKQHEQLLVKSILSDKKRNIINDQNVKNIKVRFQKINDLPPKERNIAMVFQSYALYPHMTVFDNMAFGLKLEKRSKDEINERVQEAARILQIEDYLQRKPKQLSGGQRQRVAIGRAITRKPKVFLFDEPLSNLDAGLRVNTRIELAKLHQSISATMIYVTHDQTEAMSMADKMVLMNEGEIIQQGKPKILYEKPDNTFTAKFLGNPPMNLINLEVEKNGNYIPISGEKIFVNKNSNKKNILGIRPEDIKISKKGIKCKVNDLDYQGSDVVLSLQFGNQSIFARFDSKKVDQCSRCAVYSEFDSGT